MAADLGRLRRTPGLRFAKLLGTGTGRTVTPLDAGLRHWGLPATWEGEAVTSREVVEVRAIGPRG